MTFGSKSLIPKRFLKKEKKKKRRKRSRKRSRSRSRRRKRSRSRPASRTGSQFRVISRRKTTTPKRFRNMDRRIPQPTGGAFRLAVSGSSGSGKTVLLLSLLNEYIKYYDQIAVMTPATRQFTKHLRMRPTDYVGPFDQQKMKKMYDAHLTRNRHRGKTGYLLFVLDDVVLRLKKSKAFSEMLINGRKHGVSFIVTTQRFVELSDLTKENISNAALFTGGERALTNVGAYMNIPAKKLIKLFGKYVAPKRYAFLHIKSAPAEIYLKFSNKKLYPRRSRSRRRRKRSRSRSRRRR